MNANYPKFIHIAKEIIHEAVENQEAQIIEAGTIIADAIEKGGIIQAFGSGHSYGTAIEICGRAGGYIPSKAISTLGVPEIIEGNGTEIMKSVDVREHDVFVVVSNSGRNPLGIEIAMAAKAKGAKVIVITSYKSSKLLTSKHSSGKKLYECGDVVLDNYAPDGDATLHVDGIETNVCGVSSISGAVLAQCMILESIDILIKRGIQPPVFMSMNVDGGPEFNEEMLKKYAHRIYRK